MTDTGSKVANKPPAGTAAVVRRDPDEERRKTKQGLLRERAPRPPGQSFGGELPSFSLAVGRTAIPPSPDEKRDPEEAVAPAPQPEPVSAPAPAPAPASISAPVPAPVAPLAVPSGLLELSEPGDRLEREADEAAERVVRRLAVAPGGAAGDAIPPRPPEPPPAYARGLLVQRASLVEVVAESAGLVPRLDSPGGLIVDDRTETLTPGQMKKTPFLAQMREVVTETAERELRRAGRSAQDCPYLEEILGRFARRSPDQLERAIRRYAPEARAATRARDYLPPLATRLGQGIATWARTGRTPDNLPDEFRPGRLSDFLEVGASLGRAARALFKGKDGGPGRPGVDPAALAGQLGPGRPLDGSARARMESAFGHPFGDVRLHVDDRAAALSRELEARAFTLGSHVAFGAGQFHPGTPAGDALLAHELAHVVQQRGARPAPDSVENEHSSALEHDADIAAAEATTEAPPDMAEREADQAAAGVLSHLHGDARIPAPRDGSLMGRLGGAPRLQRCGGAPSLPQANPKDLRTGTGLPPNAAAGRKLRESLGFPIGVAVPAGTKTGDVAKTDPKTPEEPVVDVDWDGVATATRSEAEAADNRAALEGQIHAAIDAALDAEVVKHTGGTMTHAPLDMAEGPCRAAQMVVDRHFESWIGAASASPRRRAMREDHVFRVGTNLFESSDVDARKAHDVPINLGTLALDLANTAQGSRGAMQEHRLAPPRSDAEGEFFIGVINRFVAGNPERQRKLASIEAHGHLTSPDNTVFLSTLIPAGLDLGPKKSARYAIKWGLFQICVHEYLHTLAHPVFSQALAGKSIGTEGFTEMFKKEVILSVLPNAHADTELRRAVETDDFVPVIPENLQAKYRELIGVYKTTEQYVDDLAAAETLRGRLGSDRAVGSDRCHRGSIAPGGYNAVKAAYFQGHVELLGLDPEGKEGPTAAPDQITVPTGVTSVEKLATAANVPVEDILSANGLTVGAAVQPGRRLIVRGAREHVVVVAPGRRGEPATAEARDNIARMHGVTPAQLDRANPGVTAARGWATLTQGQRILIPRH
jgi:hypothetical protein